MSLAASGLERRRGGSRPTPRAVVLAAVVVALLFALTVPARIYWTQRGQLGQLELQQRVLLQQNRALQASVRHLQDPAFLEQIARQCLGMVRPGEIQFTVVPKNGPAPDWANRPPRFQNGASC